MLWAAPPLLPLKVVAFCLVLGFSAVGVTVPLAFSRVKVLHSESIVLECGKAFGAGVILATAMVHILPAAFTLEIAAWPALNFPLAGIFFVILLLTICRSCFCGSNSVCVAFGANGERFFQPRAQRAGKCCLKRGPRLYTSSIV